jgi:hypothetical protein
VEAAATEAEAAILALSFPSLVAEFIKESAGERIVGKSDYLSSSE